MPDNESNQNLDAYVGVDPIYQNSASVANRPYTPGDQAEAFQTFKDAQPDGPWTHSVAELEDEDGLEVEGDDDDDDETEEVQVVAPVTEEPKAASKQSVRPAARK